MAFKVALKYLDGKVSTEGRDWVQRMQQMLDPFLSPSSQSPSRASFLGFGEG